MEPACLSLVPISDDLSHRALEMRSGEPPAEARLTDRRRIAVLMQGCALLGHLNRGGWRLARGWDGARVDRSGALGSVRASPGRSPVLEQDHLRRLLHVLFDGPGTESATAVDRRRVGLRDPRRTIAGRGQARRLARRLLVRWDQRLSRLSPDEVVTDILDRAEFLWLPEYGPARMALVAEHRVAGACRHTIVGRWAFAARLKATTGELAGLEEELRTERAREHWLGEERSEDAMALAGGGRWIEAVEIWRRHPPAVPSERLALARGLHGLARFEDALEILADSTSPAARVLTASCLVHVGRPRAARRVLDRLRTERMSRADRNLAAEVELRLTRRLVRRRGAYQSRSGTAKGPGARRRLPSRLLEAEAAWQHRDLRTLARHLSTPNRHSGQAGQSWRWRRLRSLVALEDGELERGGAGLRAVLGANRRLLDRPQAAELWRDLGLARALSGDLWAAEKSLRRAVHLLRETGSGRPSSSVWQALVEIRLRLGRPDGVRRFLREAETAAERNGDIGSAMRVATLRVRHSLLEGRPREALEWARQARQRADSYRRLPLAVADDLRLLGPLSARAQGWLGRREESHLALETCAREAWRRLEPEEEALAWLVAGDPARARQAASSDPVGRLIRRLADDRGPSRDQWRSLETLEPYRAARLVYDLVLTQPESVPPEWLRRAARELRGIGADEPARRVELADAGAWRALRIYARSTESQPAMADLFHTAGYRDVRLVWHEEAREIELIPGAGGEEERSVDLAGGRLVLTAPHVDEPLETLFAIAGRDFRPPRPHGSSARAGSGGILGRDPDLLAALERVDRLAASDLPLLVEGETGTGKELVARRAHAASPRRERPFVAINCAALPDSLLLTDLFGHIRGAFTGADRDRKGVFEAAAGGTVLLDEIGDLPKAAQGKLLRVLQEGEVRRVGESQARQVNIRVLAATHRSLAEMVGEGGFREDLYYRLNVGHVVLPPLRNRGDDAIELAESFLAERGLVLDPSAREALGRHHWPGNVRELRNVLDVAAALVDGRSVGPGDLEIPTVRGTGRGQSSVGPGYHQRVEAFRRQLLERALLDSGGVRAEAARRLGLSRQAISYLTSSLGVD